MMTEIEKYRNQLLNEFQRINNLRFRDLALLRCALTHKSFKNENLSIDYDNERLEFLGDSIINFIVTDILYKEFPNYMEGQLSKIKAFITSGDFLYNKAKKMKIGHYIFLGRGEESTGGRNKRSLLSNTYEALIGAIYLDGGITKARSFIKKQLLKDIKVFGSGHIVFDYKAALQEFIHSKDKLLPKYNVEKVTGPDHNREYQVSITIGDRTFGPEKGKTKKEAEKKLAKRVLDEIMLARD